MQDRVSLYPGRVKLEPVAGQANLYDLTRADQPTQDGTPLNKATLLKDTTAALFGFGADAVPDDAFSLLSRFNEGLGNEYLWSRSDGVYVNSPDPNAYPPAVPDGYTYTELGQLGNMAQIATGSYIGTGTYGNSNPNTLTFNFKPKYVLIYGTQTSGRNGITEYVFPCLLLTNVYTQYAYIYLSSVDEYSWAKVNENTLSWYSSVGSAFNARNQQANNGDYTYYYIAIG